MGSLNCNCHLKMRRRLQTRPIPEKVKNHSSFISLAGTWLVSGITSSKTNSVLPLLVQAIQEVINLKRKMAM